jgi:ferredoxin
LEEATMGSIVDRIKDESVRTRMRGVIEAHPGRISPDSFTPNPGWAEMFKEVCKDDDVIWVPQDSLIKKINVDEPIDKVPDMILPSKAVEQVIENASHRVIMNFCVCRESLQCKDYPIDIGCLFMGEAAKKIHPELGREATVDEALEVAARAREAGLVHCVGRSGFDPLWLDVGPAHELFTICNCCPCCCITRTIPYAYPIIGEGFTRMPGIKATVTDDCTGCGICVEEACLFQAVSIEGDRAVINEEACRACGRCASFCPEEAVEITIEDPDYIGKTIDHLKKLNYA